MSAAWTSFKIGVFSLVVAASLLAIALALGIRPGPRETVSYVTYFDESVAGLDVGAVVQFRGITIGTVEDIRIAPDGRRVEVAMKVDAKDAWMLDWDRRGDDGLRAHVSSPGITGVKLVDLEFLDPASHPPPRLAFAPPENYVPAAPAAGIQESLTSITEATVDTLERISRLVDDVRAEGVPARVSAAVSSVEGAATDLRTTLTNVNRERIPARTSETIGRLDTAVASIQRILERLDADGGVINGAERAASSIDALGARAAGATDDLDRTLRDLGDAARAMRSLADAVERDPDMLLKGRQKGKSTR
jgi:paraquat-inducible protein B